MAELLNLRRARKRKSREDKEKAAAEQRLLHGVPKPEREAEALRRRRAESHLEGHLRLHPGGPAR